MKLTALGATAIVLCLALYLAITSDSLSQHALSIVVACLALMASGGAWLAHYVRDFVQSESPLSPGAHNPFEQLTVVPPALMIFIGAMGLLIVLRTEGLRLAF